MGIALSTIDLSKETQIESKSIEDWIGYDNYIRNIADHLPKDTDIKYLMPTKYGNKINYSKSAFNSMSPQLKRLSASIYETAAAIHRRVNKNLNEPLKENHEKTKPENVVTELIQPKHPRYQILNYPS